MADMTPTRLKRVSKVPNRFSSEQSRIKITSSPGETIIDYNSNTVSTTRNVMPANKPIKLKTPTNEPFKIKLPIKRPFVSPSKDSSTSDRLNTKVKQIKTSSSAISSYYKIKSDKPISILKPPTSSTKSISKPSKQSKNIAKFTEPKTVTDNVFPTPPSSQDSPNCKSNSPPQINCISQARPPVTNMSLDKNIDSSQSLVKSQVKVVENDSQTLKNVDSVNQDVGPKTEETDETEVTATDDNCIRCPCGVNDDLGVMVECEKCHFWQHGHCINIANEDDAFDGYYCPYCVIPKDKVQESLLMLNHNDEFQSRFDLLESQIEKGSTQSNDMSSKFSLDELCRAAMDVNRIVRSLIAKWKLYQTPYISDIRIYQNPIWGHDSNKSPRESSSFYFVDNCKANLKTNILTMAAKLETRVALLEHQFSPLEKSGQLTERDEKLVEKIKRTIHEFRHEMSTIQSNLPELQSS